jgi:hypothetical protein
MNLLVAGIYPSRPQRFARRFGVGFFLFIVTF